LKKAKKITKIESKKETCFLCNGKGQVMLSCCTGDLVDEDIARCPKCKENVAEDTCPECNGTGER